MRRIMLSLAIGLSLLADCSGAAASPFTTSKPSFGLVDKKSVVLKTRLPPLYNASGKTIAIDIGRGTAEPANSVEISIEQQLTQNDSTITVSTTKPDLVIACQVTRFSTPRKQQSTVQGTTGTITRIVGSLSVTFRIAEPHNGHVVKSDIATSDYDEQISSPATTSGFHLPLPGILSNLPSPMHQAKNEEEALRLLIADVATKIASYLVNTEQPVGVALAVNGGLDSPDRLAASGLWSRNLEELETLPPFADSKTDAYRIYNIGVANEALGYQASDVKAALKYLQQASIDYGKALDQHPEEKNFLQPQNRIKAALAHYTELAQAGQRPSSNRPDPPTPAGPPHAGPDPTVSGDAPLTNDDVVAMVKNLDEANVLDTIQTSPAVQFNLTPQGQIELARGGVGGKVLLAMKQRARGGPASAAAAPAAAAPAVHRGNALRR